jgi:hypothetical protein
MQTRISCPVIVCLLATVEELYDLHAYWVALASSVDGLVMIDIEVEHGALLS